MTFPNTGPGNVGVLVALGRGVGGLTCHDPGRAYCRDRVLGRAGGGSARRLWRFGVERRGLGDHDVTGSGRGSPLPGRDLPRGDRLGVASETEDAYRSPPSSFTMDPSEPSYSIQKGVNDAYVAAGIRHYATSSWWDATLKKASSFANLVSTGAGAESAMNAEREFAQSWFPRFEGTPIHEFKADGIGEHSWAVRANRTNGSFAEIGWTRGNLVLSVYVSCFPCHADVGDAARRWAETIDRAASAGPS